MIECKTKMTCDFCGRTELLPRDGQARRRWRRVRIEKEVGVKSVVGVNERDNEYAQEMIPVWKHECTNEICGACYKRVRGLRK